jgi:hypothetical protein
MLQKTKKKKYKDISTTWLTPKIVDFGSLIIKDNSGTKLLYHYMVLPRYKQTLENYLESNKYIEHSEIFHYSI